MDSPKITIFTALNNYSDFNGRATRKEFWLFQLLVFLVSSIIWGLLTLCNASETILEYVSILIAFLFLFPCLAVNVRRLHDRNLSGWFFLLFLFIPVIGWIILLVIYFLPSKQEAKKESSNNSAC